MQTDRAVAAAIPNAGATSVAARATAPDLGSRVQRGALVEERVEIDAAVQGIHLPLGLDAADEPVLGIGLRWRWHEPPERG